MENKAFRAHQIKAIAGVFPVDWFNEKFHKSTSNFG